MILPEPIRYGFPIVPGPRKFLFSSGKTDFTQDLSKTALLPEYLDGDTVARRSIAITESGVCKDLYRVTRDVIYLGYRVTGCHGKGIQGIRKRLTSRRLLQGNISVA